MSGGLLGGGSPLIVVVGAGGVGKTTLAAALGVESAGRGRNTLVMTFDPSLRLKDALGVDDAARDHEVPVALGAGGGAGRGRLDASLLDARRTFDRLVERYAPDEEAKRRILDNRFYRHLAGTLSGVLEYMAVERLFEVATSGRYDQVILDTPPTRQALDFLEAPERIVGFLDSGALKIAMKEWFDDDGRLRTPTGFGFFGRRIEGLLDRVVGLAFVRDMLEFFQAFGPLYAGFRERAQEVEALLASEETRFVLVSAPGEEQVSDTLFFARKLGEAGYRLGPVVVNRVHPEHGAEGDAGAAGGEGAAGAAGVAGTAGAAGDPVGCVPDGRHLFAWLGSRDRRGVESLRELLGTSHQVAEVPLVPDEPTDLPSLKALGAELMSRLD